MEKAGRSELLLQLVPGNLARTDTCHTAVAGSTFYFGIFWPGASLEDLVEIAAIIEDLVRQAKPDV